MATAAVQSQASALHSIPPTQTAIIASQAGDFEISSTVPVPQPESDEVLIKTKAVGLNPVDTKLVGEFVTAGCIFGFDCSGIVVAVGSKVTNLKVGDRVCGAASGKVRAMIDDHGRQVKEAGPSMPVEVLGLGSVPSAGDQLTVVENEARAREVAAYRQGVLDRKRTTAAPMTLASSSGSCASELAPRATRSTRAALRGCWTAPPPLDPSAVLT